MTAPRLLQAKPRRADLFAVVFLFAVALAFCGRAAFTGRALLPLDMLLLMSPWKAHAARLAPDFLLPQNPMLDPVQQYYPWRVFAVDSLKSGTIPLWNPFSYCGQPFLANLQSALFYPLNLIFLILDLPTAFTWGAALHLFLAGLFCYGLLRQWGLLPLAGLVGAVAFMLNGYIIGWLEYPAFGLWVIIWLPAILLCYEKSLSPNGRKWVLLTGLAIGAQFLGGQLQISAYVMTAFLLYTAWRAFSAKGGRLIVGRLGRAAAALALGLALAAVQLLPTAELAPLSARSPKTLEEAQGFALPLTHLILFLIPNFFGNPAHYNYWGDLGGRYPINFFETGCYVGLITLLFAWLAIRLWRNPLVSFLLALVVISLLLALGSPLFSIFFYLVPGMRQLAGLARVLCLTAFGLAALAAFGTQRLLARDLPLGKWELPAFGLAAVLAATAAWPLFAGVFQQNPPLLENFLHQGLRFLVLLILALSSAWLLSRRASEVHPRRGAPPRRALPTLASLLALALLMADLFSFGLRFNPATEARLAFFPTQTTDFLQAQGRHDRIVSYRPSRNSPRAALEWMLPNTPLVYQLRDVHGYDSLAPGRYLRLIGSPDWAAQGNWPAPASALADLLGIKYAITTAELKAPAWELVHSAEANIYYNREALPRAFLVGRARQVAEKECLERMRSGRFGFREEVLLMGKSIGGSRAVPRQGGLAGEVEFLEEGINSVVLQARCLENAWLVLMDTAYPGWKVEIDGKAQPWQVANYAFRAVAVPHGRHVVKWAFRPASFKVGLFFSLIAAALLCGFLGYYASRLRCLPSVTQGR